jgi:hypothetical protein
MTSDQSLMQPYDIGAAIDAHYDFRNKIIPEFLALGKKAFQLQCELDKAIAEVEQSRKWIKYYKNKSDQMNLVTKQIS